MSPAPIEPPEPRDYELALAVLLLAAAVVLVARSRSHLGQVRQAALLERGRRIDAEDEAERHGRNMDGALEHIQELNARLATADPDGDPDRAVAKRPAAARKPPGRPAARKPAGGDVA